MSIAELQIKPKSKSNQTKNLERLHKVELLFSSVEQVRLIHVH
jgi:hypothetical protein